MTGMDDTLHEARLEAICQLGCQRVRVIIHALANGETVAEAGGLTPDERARLLRELQSVMAVYGDHCRL